jgi:hypothetical protein
MIWNKIIKNDIEIKFGVATALDKQKQAANSKCSLVTSIFFHKLVSFMILFNHANYKV